MAAADAFADQRPAPFKLERFFERWEFKAPHLLCASDCEPLPMAELLDLADADAKARWEGLKLSYTEPQGLLALREAVAAEVYGGEVAPEQLLVCAPEEGIYLAMQALLRPGDRVVCAYPAYQSLYELAASLGCHLDMWEAEWRPEEGRHAFSVERLEALVAGGGGKPPPRLVVVNFPHNPTGATLTPAGAARVVTACEAAGAYLFSDEMYYMLEPQPSARLPPAVTRYDKAVTLCGLSKSWAAPGLRIGWLATRDAPLLKRVAALKDYTTICSAGPSEVLALIAVRNTGALTARSRAIVAANTERAAALFRRWAALFDFAPPGAGPIVFPRLKVAAAAAADPSITSIDAFCAAAVEDAGVLLLPASVYDHAPSVEGGHFRLGLGRETAAAALAALDGFLTKRFPGLVATP